MLAVTADHYIKVSRLGYLLEVVVVEAQQFRRDFESNCLAFTCFEEDFLEALSALSPGG